MRRNFALFFLLLLAGSSAFAQKIVYNFSKDADFAAFKTFRWAEPSNLQASDPLTDQQIRNAIDAELAKKGLTVVKDGKADLDLVYQIGIKQEQQLNTLNSGYTYGPGWRRGWGYPSTSTTTTSTITIGTLVLDFYDAAKKQMIWRGEATKTIDTNAKPDKRLKNIEKGVAKLLKDYPPPVKK